MAKIRLENITKIYGEKTALDNVSLTVEDGEFFVLFGPAGAGKTTLLNMIAGIDDPNAGSIWFDDRPMNFIEPKNRNVSMVFENYALYPQMSVYENIASPMRSRMHRASDDEIREKVMRVAKMTGMEDYLERRPAQLSNGQRQRVALSRALVRDPNVFLLDEPIAHLDAKLRNAMRKELKLMQKVLNCTSIYVTHDFTEAMSLGDRIGVLCEGKIVQVGTNAEVYYCPINEFVAKLFGDCEINIIPATVEEAEGKKVGVIGGGRVRFPIPDDVAEKLNDVTQIDLGCRTPAFYYSRTPKTDYLEASVYSIEPLGNKTELIAKLGDSLLRFIIPVSEKFRLDETVYIGLNPENIIYFDQKTQRYLACHNEKALLEV
jgi:multiple sugar transport system ATP-binding protein